MIQLKKPETLFAMDGLTSMLLALPHNVCDWVSHVQQPYLSLSILS